MYIKQFRSHLISVPDPLHPGRPAKMERLEPTGANSISHEGSTYTADPDGWFEVPHEVGTKLLSFRHPGGERFCTPVEVNEHVKLGFIEKPDAPRAAEDKRPSVRRQARVSAED